MAERIVKAAAELQAGDYVICWGSPWMVSDAWANLDDHGRNVVNVRTAAGTFEVPPFMAVVVDG